MSKPCKIVVVGGGAGGLATAEITLNQCMARIAQAMSAA